MKLETIDLYFYRNSELANIRQSARTTTILRNLDAPLAQYDTDAEVDIIFLATDDGGSVLNVKGQKKVESHSYTAYGRNPALPSQLTLSGFNGRHLDRLSDCYNLGEGYRPYSPSLMRFHSTDSLSPFGDGGRNPYSYCLGDPINRLDPTGHFSIFKPTTWFRNKANRILQRSTARNNLDAKYSELNSRLNSLADQQDRVYTLDRQSKIEGLRTSMTSTAEAFNKKTKNLNKDLSKNEQLKTKDTKAIAKLGKPNSFIDKTPKDSKLFAPTKDRSNNDQYNDSNWKVTDHAKSTRA
ncbi:hypothetical protein D3C81_597930 [compost metagenome]